MNKIIRKISGVFMASLIVLPLFSCDLSQSLSELEKENSELANELISQKESLEAEIEAQKLEYEEKMNSLIEKHSEESTTLNNKIKELNKNYENKLNNLTDSYNKLESDKRNEIKNLENQIKTNDESYRLQIEELNTKVQETKIHEIELKGQYQTQINELTLKNSQEISKLNSLIQKLQSDQISLKIQYEEEKEKLNKEYNDAVTNLNSNINDLEAKSANELEKYNLDISSLNEEHKARLNELTSEINNLNLQIEELNSKHKLEVNNLEKEHNKEILELNYQIDSLRSAHRNEINEISKEYDAKINLLLLENQKLREKINKLEGKPIVPNIDYDFNKQVSIEIYTTLSYSSEYGTYFDEALKMFSKKYNNKIIVNHTSVGGYDDLRDQLKTELGTGKGPNLAYCYQDHLALYNEFNAVQPLDNYIYNNQIDSNGNLLYGLTNKQIDDFIDTYWNEGISYSDGNMYTLPLYKSTEVLYYNMDVFTELGLSVPTHWFKDDVRQSPNTSMEYVCERLKAKYPNDYPFGYDSESNWFITLAKQLNSPYTSPSINHYQFDNEINRDFVTKLDKWFNKGYFTTQKIYGGYTSGLFSNTTDTNPRSFMSIGSSAGANHQLPDVEGAFEVGIAPIPQMNQDNRKVISQGPSLVMFKKADQQEVIASWLLMRYLTTDTNFQAEMAMKSGYVPAINSVMENKNYLNWINSGKGVPGQIAALSAKVCMEQADNYFTTPGFVGSETAREQVSSLMQSVFLKQQTVEEAFKFAISECRAQH